METDFFSCKKFNILRNGVPEIISIYHDKVAKVYLKISQFTSSLFQVFLEVLENCRKLSVELARQEIVKLFQYLEKTELFISRNVADELREFLGKETAKLTYVFSNNNDYSGKCRNCGGTLKKYRLSEEDRKKMLQTIHSFAFDSTEILNNSNPDEFRRFVKLLEAHKETKFDLVVDGLNVNYKELPARFQRNIHLMNRSLFQTLEYFADLGWKVLVIHRHVFRKSPYFKDLQELG